MKTALLTRMRTGDTGTFGRLEIMGETFATGELPDRGNAPFLSSIPAGVYECRKTWSPRHQASLYEILGVPGRDGVRFDVANWVGDKTKGLKCQVDGCVALGKGIAVIDGQLGVTDSHNVVDLFNILLGGEDFQIAITDEYLEAGASDGSQTTV